MAPRAYWKGYLKLSLVSCPILLYPATTNAERIHFHQINKKTGHRLRQQMVDEETGHVVEAKDKGRGYEVSKGHYVEIDDEELEAVQVESTHTIDIDSFVPKADIDERYLDKPYYIAPNGKTGVDAFAVIRDAMKNKGRAALGRIVLTNREHVMAIEPCGKGLIGTTLRYPNEVRKANTYFSSVPSPRVSKDMVKLAEHILDSKAARFDPSTFKDEYDTALKVLVRRKAKGKTIEIPEAEPERGNVVNLMDALRQSIGNKGRKRKGSGRARRVNRRTAASQRQRRKAA